MKRCKFCPQEATRLAAQSEDAGKTRRWVRICDAHADGWNDGGDWKAPVHPINGKRAIDILKKEG